MQVRRVVVGALCAGLVAGCGTGSVGLATAGSAARAGAAPHVDRGIAPAPEQQPRGADRDPRPGASTPDPRPGSTAAAGRSAATSPAAYTFLFPVGPDGPLRWNPCRPIHYVTNLALAPGMHADLLAALSMLSAATGLVFVDDGDTTEVPALDRPVAAAGGWSPVLIAVAGSDLLRPGDAGEGRAQWWRTGDGTTEIVTGQVVIRPGSYPTDHGGFGDPDDAGPMLLHELGHVLGLGHPGVPDEIMDHDGGQRATSLQPGDLAGLRRLGRAAGCLPTLTAPGA